jgi:hypothetical protein
MANSTGKRKALVENDRRIPYVRRGYEQARQGIAPFKEDTLIDNQILAQAYWQGRLVATAVLAAGNLPPRWNTERIAPPKVRSAVSAASKVVGVVNCSRTTHMAPDPRLDG